MGTEMWYVYMAALDLTSLRALGNYMQCVLPMGLRKNAFEYAGVTSSQRVKREPKS